MISRARSRFSHCLAGIHEMYFSIFTSRGALLSLSLSLRDTFHPIHLRSGLGTTNLISFYISHPDLRKNHLPLTSPPPYNAPLRDHCRMSPESAASDVDVAVCAAATCRVLYVGSCIEDPRRTNTEIGKRSSAFLVWQLQTLATSLIK